MKRDKLPDATSKPLRLIRVRRAESMRPADTWAKPDPVDMCLEIWKGWMAGDADKDLGMKTMRGLRGEGDGHGVDVYEAQQANDVRIAEATNAAIDSMPRLFVWAIYRACSMATFGISRMRRSWMSPPKRVSNLLSNCAKIFALRFYSNHLCRPPSLLSLL